ncbi:MAG: ribosome biogenesis GTPase YlqF [Pseudomonadales bacterium]|nr:ribosome biogenesis GTPase YlqF [Pseudomonadales bacterium]
MAINWYPGHMHKAKKEIREVLTQVDVLIELLDARIPFSSGNPMVPGLREDKPMLKILNKSDLADPLATQHWLTHLNQEAGTKAVALSQKQAGSTNDILKHCQSMVATRGTAEKPLRVLILGIPNVGKSTLINNLAGRVIAKTGNEPAVTKTQQRIKITDCITLFDTPGFLWPKLEPEASGYRLAATGAVKNTIYEAEDVALFAAEYLLEQYGPALQNRYELGSLPATGIELLDAIAARRGCLRKGGLADLNKVSNLFLNELREGALGGITLETPELVAREGAELEVQKQLAAEKKAARKAGARNKSGRAPRK